MYGIRVGEEEPHSVSPQDGLLFTLTVVSPNLKTRDHRLSRFFESEQDTNYVNGLTEEPRDM